MNMQPGPQQDAPDPYDDELHPMEYVLVLWRRRWLILGATLLCGLAAFTAGKLSPPVYEASVKLLVAQSKTVGAGEIAPVVSVATFRALVENQSLAAQVVSEFKLDQPPMRMTPESFLRGALSVETVRDTNVVVLRVRLPSKDLPSKVANRLAVLAVELAARLSQDETVHSRDLIKAQLDQTRTLFDGAEARVEAYRKEAQVDLLKKDVDSLLDQRGELVDLTVQIAAEKARVAQAERELAKQQEVRAAPRSVDLQPTFSIDSQPEPASEARPPQKELKSRERIAEAPRVPEAQFRNDALSPYINPVYEILQQQVTTSRTRLAGLERQRAEMVGDLKLGGAQLAKLSELYSRQSELARLETEHDLAKAVYIDVATRFEQARLQVAGRSAQLQVMDSALPSDRQVGPRVLRNTAAAIVMGFLFSSLAALFLSALASATGRRQITEVAPTGPHAQV
jgi:uncharacterized protein involved in exopolysaccharide biosynthesis